jgi:hypothetical protein
VTRSASHATERKTQPKAGIHRKEGFATELFVEPGLQPASRNPVVDHASQHGCGRSRGNMRRYTAPANAAPNVFFMRCRPSNGGDVVNAVSDEGVTKARPAPVRRLLGPDPLTGPVERAACRRAFELPANGKRDGGEHSGSGAAVQCAMRGLFPRRRHVMSLRVCGYC